MYESALTPGPGYADVAARLITAPAAAWFLEAGGRLEMADGCPGWFLDWQSDAVPDEAPANPFGELRTSLEAGAGLLAHVCSEQARISAAQARQARAVAGFCRSRPASNDRPDSEVGAAAAATRAARHRSLLPVSEWAVDEVATALSVTSARAERLMVQSLQLTDRLPSTLDALEAGTLTWDHAAVLCEVVAPLDDEVRAEAEQRVLARLGRKTPTQLRAAAHRVVQRLDGLAISRRVEAAIRERGVAVHPTGDGLGSLSLTNLPLPVLRAVEDALRRYADAARVPGDTRTRQQRMADCLVDLVLRPGAHGLAPVQALLTVVATVGTLLGGDEPGQVGGDTVPAETVRALARSLGLLPAGPPAAEPAPPEAADLVAPGGSRAQGLRDLVAARPGSGTALAERPRVAVVDELTGQLLALTDAAGLRAGRGLGPPPGTDAYEPTAELVRHVRHRDLRCRFPGCRLPGRRCDQHHLVRWPEGDTSVENLCCLCRHHHRLVHQAPGWQLHALTSGALRFTTPTGQVLVSRPPGPHEDDPPVHDLHPGAPPGDDPPPF